MNLLGKLQNEYDQLWKYIIRPTRTAYAQQSLGPYYLKLENKELRRTDFQLTNARGYVFAGSLWMSTDVSSSSPTPCVVYLHSNSGNRTEGMEYLGKLARHNIALCTFDFSGSGNAEGEFVTLGYYEQEDLRLVIDYLRMERKIGELAVWGRSMGAVASLLYLGKTIEVKAAVLDSPFKSLKALVEEMAGRNSKIPKFVLTGALKIIGKTIEEKALFSINNINPLKYSVPGLYVPAFFLAALDDELVPPSHSKELHAAYAGEHKRIQLVKGKHNDPRPEDCLNEIVDFLIEQFHGKPLDKEIIKKQFDFFEAQKQGAEKEKEIQKTAEDVDFFAEEHSPQEQKEVEESIKKGEFSLAGLFSIFSKDKEKEKEKEPTKKKEKKQQPKDGFDQTRQTLSKRFHEEDTIQTNTLRSQRRNLEQKFTTDCQSLPESTLQGWTIAC